jgi:hypothetical protein
LEDDRHEILVRRYLIKCGFKAHEMRIQKAGPAICVLRRFAKEVSAYRSRQARAQSALIVVIDADTDTVQHRLSQLDEELRNNGKSIIEPNKERVARLVPKRNIETWILCLNGHDVDEQIDYKTPRHDWSELIRSASANLFEWTQSRVPPNHCVESLRRGIEELVRLRS